MRIAPQRHAQSPASGFTLIELLVTMAILAALMMIATPAMFGAIQNARLSSTVRRLPQDIAWARNAAASSSTPMRVNLGADCQWETQAKRIKGKVLEWITIDAHSHSGASAAKSRLECTVDGGPQSLVFDSQGLITSGNAPKVEMISSGGQTWHLQVLLSGFVLLHSRTSS